MIADQIETIALELEFRPDNYYTAAEKMFHQRKSMMRISTQFNIR